MVPSTHLTLVKEGHRVIMCAGCISSWKPTSDAMIHRSSSVVQVLITHATVSTAWKHRKPGKCECQMPFTTHVFGQILARFLEYFWANLGTFSGILDYHHQCLRSYNCLQPRCPSCQTRQM